jgi:hypothetical protein
MKQDLSKLTGTELAYLFIKEERQDVFEAGVANMGLCEFNALCDMIKSDISYIDFQVANVAQLRDAYERRKQAYADLIAQHYDALLERDACKRAVESAEELLRNMVLDIHQKTGIKKLPATLVKRQQDVIYEERDALIWADENAKYMVKKVLDVKAFEHAVLDGAVPESVATVKEGFTATISKDLSFYLPQPQVAEEEYLDESQCDSVTDYESQFIGRPC